VLENPLEVVGLDLLLIPQGELEGQVRPGQGADWEVLFLHIAHHGTHQRNAKNSR
jgi:hypothetical protein